MLETLKKIISFLSWSLAGLMVCTVFVGLFSLIIGLSSGVDGSEDSLLTGRGVAVVEITGEILSADEFRQEIRKHVKNDLVKGIVVDINSPGGAVGASEEMYRIIKWARETKPVMCAMGTIAASGGLYAALGCEKIVANKGTLTGSIGVILAMPNVGEIMNKLGVGMTIIKSGKYKDAGSPFRAMSSDDQQYLQSVVNLAYEQFVSVIATERKLEIEKVKEFADGRVILGEQAVTLGLADQVGGLQVAGRLTLEAAGVKGEPEFMFKDKKEGLLKYFNNVSSYLSHFASISRIETPQLLYKIGYY